MTGLWMNRRAWHPTAGAALLHRRFMLKAGLAGAATAAVGLPALPVLGQAKRFAGVTINGTSFQHTYHIALKKWLPEFEEATGMKVNLDLNGMPVFIQRTDLELSTRGSAYDFINLGMPVAGRWISSGWMTKLDEFIANPNLTSPDFEAGDFAAGAQAVFAGPDGTGTYGFAWVAGAILMGVARSDILEKAGLPMPKTVEELLETCRKTNQPNSTFAFVNDALHHWEWPPYLMAMGGMIFRNPPQDVMPMINSPEAIRAAQIYAELLSKYSPPGVISFTDDQAMRYQFAGRANIRTTSIDWLVPIGKNPDSKTRETMRFEPMPGGPAGSFPAVNANGFGIPAGAKNKEAAWTFIQWATSKRIFKRQVLENAYVTVPRRSVVTSAEYHDANMINGQDVGKLYLDTVEASAPRVYMKYRNNPMFPLVGEKINKAIEQIASGQMDAKAAMDAAQQAAVADIAKAGVKL
jgi:multiple sugar transport system substrate-binding protein